VTTTRFAPSPTGHLHLGHAFAARVAWERARNSGGRFLLRIEDLDHSRCHTDGYEASILDDLHWFGLDWDGPIVHQSTRREHYEAALATLDNLGLLYPCFCTRGEIRAEIAAMGQAPHAEDAAPVYPGTCRRLPDADRAERLATGTPHAVRFDIAAALHLTGPLHWHDRRAGRQTCRPEVIGDPILTRKDGSIAYHLAVVVDDAAQGITLVTRGDDLFPSTHLHRLLQAVLHLPVPEWEHHPLILDADGKRLAKRDAPHSLRQLREAGHTPASLIERFPKI